jgi:hypothetical protein
LFSHARTQAKAAPFVRKPQNISCAALKRAQQCKAKCMPVTIWVNAGVIAL